MMRLGYSGIVFKQRYSLIVLKDMQWIAMSQNMMATEYVTENYFYHYCSFTLMATANVTGDYQLPLMFTQKSAIVTGYNMSALPVHY